MKISLLCTFAATSNAVIAYEPDPGPSSEDDFSSSDAEGKETSSFLCTDTVTQTGKCRKTGFGPSWLSAWKYSPCPNKTHIGLAKK